MSTSFQTNAKNDRIDLFAPALGLCVNSADWTRRRTAASLSAWRARVDGRAQNSSSDQSAAAIWATRRFLSFARRVRVFFMPCALSESDSRRFVGKSAGVSWASSPWTSRLLCYRRLSVMCGLQRPAC